MFPLLPNTTLLFCSDGLTDLVTSSTIASVLGREGSLEEKVDALIKAALEAGGKDNVTVVLFEYQSDEPESVPVEPEIKKENTMSQSMAEETAGDAGDRQSTKRTWPLVFACLVLGALVGTLVVFSGMNHKINKLKEVQKEEVSCYKDSLAFLYDSIEKLNNQIQDTIPIIDSVSLNE